MVTYSVILSFHSLLVVNIFNNSIITPIILDVRRRLILVMMLVHYIYHPCGEYYRSANKHFSMVSYRTKPCIYVSYMSWWQRTVPIISKRPVPPTKLTLMFFTMSLHFQPVFHIPERCPFEVLRRRASFEINSDIVSDCFQYGSRLHPCFWFSCCDFSLRVWKWYRAW